MRDKNIVPARLVALTTAAQILASLGAAASSYPQYRADIMFVEALLSGILWFVAAMAPLFREASGKQPDFSTALNALAAAATSGAAMASIKLY